MPKFTRRNRPSKSRIVFYLLESGSIKDIRRAKELTDELLKYQWAYYSELARQRNEIQDKIQQAVIQHEKVPVRIGATNWRVCDLEAKEVIG